MERSVDPHLSHHLQWLRDIISNFHLFSLYGNVFILYIYVSYYFSYYIYPFLFKSSCLLVHSLICIPCFKELIQQKYTSWESWRWACDPSSPISGLSTKRQFQLLLSPIFAESKRQSGEILQNSRLKLVKFHPFILVVSQQKTFWLVVSTYPSEKWWTSSVGIIVPNWMESHKIHVPKHQPVKWNITFIVDLPITKWWQTTNQPFIFHYQRVNQHKITIKSPLNHQQKTFHISHFPPICITNKWRNSDHRGAAFLAPAASRRWKWGPNMGLSWKEGQNPCTLVNG